jgi:tetratricopeptide (TPR) repeat protein
LTGEVRQFQPVEKKEGLKKQMGKVKRVLLGAFLLALLGVCACGTKDTEEAKSGEMQSEYTPTPKLSSSEKKEYYETAEKKYSEGDLLRALELYLKLGKYKDAKEKVAECEDVVYSDAKKLYKAEDYEEAMEAFIILGGYEDSREYVEKCQDNIDYHEALLKFEKAEQSKKPTDYKSTRELFLKLGDFEDSVYYADESGYRCAVLYMNDGRLEDAYNAFKEVGDYEDSEKLGKDCYQRFNYEYAVAKLQAGKDSEAVEYFKKIPGYKDSDRQIDRITNENGGNETYAEATEVKVNQNYQMQISSTDDIDWYKIELEKEAILKFELKNDKKNVSLFLSKDGSKSSELLKASTDASVATKAYQLPEGTYYLRAQSVKKSDQIPGEYSFSITEVSGDYSFIEIESNDELDNATQIKCGINCEGNLENESSERSGDWYIFELEKDCVVSITGTMGANTNALSCVMGIYRNPTWYSPSWGSSYWDGNVMDVTVGVGSMATSDLISFKAGTYYVHVYSGNGEYAFTVNAEVTDTKKLGREIEYNNNPTAANEIEIGKEYSGELKNETFEHSLLGDWFVFELDKDSVVSITGTLKHRGDASSCKMGIYQNPTWYTSHYYYVSSKWQGNVVGMTVGVGSTATSDLIPFKAGTYYVYVYSGNGEYTFTVNSEANK